LVKEYGLPRVIIIDTLSRNFGQGDENTQKDMSAFVAALDKLKASYGCAIVVVHHTGHQSQDRARGSSTFKAALDFEYILKIKGVDRVLSCTKCKDHEPSPTLVFTPVSVNTGWIDEETLENITSCALELTASQQQDAKYPRLTEPQRLVLEALHETCARADGPVPVSKWHKAACEKEGLTKSSEQGAKAKAFKRAFTELHRRGLALHEGALWSPCGEVGRKGQNTEMPTSSGDIKTGQTGHTPLGVSSCPIVLPDEELAATKGTKSESRRGGHHGKSR